MAKNFIGTPSVYPKLLEIRKSTTAKFKTTKHLKETTVLRYYQVIGALHMMLLDRMVLGDGTGLGKCVNSMTYVQSSEGLLEIKDLAIKYGFNLKADTLYELPEDFSILSIEGPHRASHLYYSGHHEGLRIITHKGFELSGLSHHPIFCPQEGELVYKRLDEIKTNDYVCINRGGLFSVNYCFIHYESSSTCNKYEVPLILHEELSELLGYYVSEGNNSKKWSLTITQHYDEIRNRIRFLLKSVFNYEETGFNKSFCVEVVINSLFIKEIFDYLGVNTGGKSEGQVVPGTVLSSPKSVIVAFLRGYFEGDGSVEVSNKIVSCSSKSEKLLKQVQILLLQFGIVSRRKKKWVKVKNGKNLYWILYFCGKNVEIFQKEIGFVSERKQKSLEEIRSEKRNTNDDIIPMGSIILKQAMSDIISHLRKLPEQKNFSSKGSGWKGLVGVQYKEKLEKYIYKKRRLTYEGLKEFLYKIESLKLAPVVSNYSFLKDIMNNNIFFDKVVSKEKSIDEYFDLHVPEVHNFIGNGFINHNTLQGIAAYSFALEQKQNLKLLIVCPKSATTQWAEEFEKFSVGITCRVISNEFKELTGYTKNGKPKYKTISGFPARKLQYAEFKENVLIMNYAPVINEYEFIANTLSPNFMIIYDEIQVFKNRKSKTHFACKSIAERAERVYGFSATIIKNDLEEVWGIYDVIVPGMFGNISNFIKNYCKTKLMKLQIKGKTRHIPKVIGYKNLAKFKQTLDPYFLIRKKEQVASELPKLISKKAVLEMSSAQRQLYNDALSGILHEEKIQGEYFEMVDHIRNVGEENISDKEKKKYIALKEKYQTVLSPEGKKRGKLAALTYCQMISNGPGLLKEEGDSSKEEEFLRLMKEELVTEKVIVYTRFKTGIPFLEIGCDRSGINHVKITGDCDDHERKRARISFQEDPDCKVIFITSAGSAALNLQSASVLIFYDTPWSYGDLVQTIGRAQRIGSLQEHILIIHMVNRGTIDEHVLKRVTSKKDLSDSIIGDTAEGALDFTAYEGNSINDLYDDLLHDAEGFK